MPKPLIRIPYTGALPPPLFVPRTSNTRAGALAALQTLLRAPTLGPPATAHGQTVILSGAGVSVASGLADYRGEAGTYTLNKTYRPIYYGEFLESHAARQRYWARSFLGWTTLHRARPNAAHRAIQALGELGYVSSVITQSAPLPFLLASSVGFLQLTVPANEQTSTASTPARTRPCPPSSCTATCAPWSACSAGASRRATPSSSAWPR